MPQLETDCEDGRNLGGRPGDVGLYSTVLMFSLRCFRVAKASFFTCLVLLLVTAIASGQTAPEKATPDRATRKIR